MSNLAGCNTKSMALQVIYHQTILKHSIFYLQFFAESIRATRLIFYFFLKFYASPFLSPSSRTDVYCAISIPVGKC